MTRTFEEMRTGAMLQEWQDLLRHIEHQLNLTIETYGGDSIEAAQLHQILGFMQHVVGNLGQADQHIRSHVTISEQKIGATSSELLSGLELLANNCRKMDRPEEARSVLERVKFISERCSHGSEPLLDTLIEFAERCGRENHPSSQKRRFMVSMLALNWCVRYPSGHNYGQFSRGEIAGDHQIYARYIPKLKSGLEIYGFVQDRWDWLIRYSKHNLHDLIGLTSILLEGRIFPMDAQPPLTMGSREDFFRSLLSKFPVGGERDLKKRILATGGYPVKLEFLCPLCGSRDLRTMFMEPYYPISTLDGIAVDPSNVDLCDLIEREPSEYEGQGHTEGWQFWCDKCGLEPALDQDHEEEEGQEEALARWLLDNCPQDEGLPDTDNSRSQG